MKLLPNSPLLVAISNSIELFKLVKGFKIDVSVENYLFINALFSLKYIHVDDGKANWTIKQTPESIIDYLTSVCGSIENLQLIEDNFYQVTPSGNEEKGILALIGWIEKRKMDIPSTVTKYISDYQSYQNYKDANGLVVATSKQKNGYLDKIYYCDFYTHGNFGKTKLGSWTFYGKAGPNPKLIQNAIDFTKTQILSLIKELNIEAIGYVAPTNQRTIQFMTELEKKLNIDLPKIQITKIQTPVKVAQKTLKSIEDRIENADKTFEISSSQSYNKILLIDDLIGSGSTLQQTAKKLRDQKIATGQIIGLAIVGSENGVVNTSAKFETLVEA
jgi:adenine/guanine phosphoribosyltransferase-like PRPP-binding protein